MALDTLALWHQAVKDRDMGVLDRLVADDAVFLSPAVHSPQPGKALVIKYLNAAQKVLINDSFHYVEEWHGDHSAVLEFALEIDGIRINGVDLIHWNEAGEITQFKVMMRPMKGLNTIIPLMAAHLV